jgi:hypothetical protein
MAPSDEKQVAVSLPVTQIYEQQQKEVVQGHPAYTPELAATHSHRPAQSPNQANLPEVVHEMSDTRKPPAEGYSDLPEVAYAAAHTGDSELQNIEAEMQRLNERRTRLIEMDRLDADERELRRRYITRMAQLGRG